MEHKHGDQLRLPLALTEATIPIPAETQEACRHLLTLLLIEVVEAERRSASEENAHE